VRRANAGCAATSKLLLQGLAPALVRPHGLEMVGLRDGTAVAGWPYAYTVEPAEPAQRELVLATPLRVRARGETEFKDAREHFVFLSGEDIRTLSIQYHRVNAQEVPGRLPRLARWLYHKRLAREHERIRRGVLTQPDDEAQ
jgi:hypothetical protein